MSDNKGKNRGLGRGLSALMADVSVPRDETDQPRPKPELTVPVEKLHPNPDQPRRSFDPEALEELTRSIAEKGVLQPLIVRPDPRRPGEYQIVAGERRWRAAQAAQLHEVPVLVRDFNDTEVLEVAIIENIQRDDLNPLDEALSYKQLMERFGHTQEQLSTALGKSRSYIANLTRLLTLPEGVHRYMREGRLSAGAARALVGRPDALFLAGEIVRKGLSVREVEALVRKADRRKTAKPASGPKPEKDADTRQMEQDLSAHLGLKVNIEHHAGKESGKLVLNYRSLEQLDDILRKLGGD